MKYSLALAALVAVAAAQVDPTIIPTTTSATTCKEGDYSCTCKPDNKAAIQTAATGCVVSACGIDKALST
ncbi:CFEM domain-containing protein [Colletotrichum tofieldiae]|nr:CFEM domain-containing protein [Colletotrichum tofieldiae]